MFKENKPPSSPVLTGSRRLQSPDDEAPDGGTSHLGTSTLDHLRLFHAFYHGYIKELQTLLRTTVSPNEKNADGNSLLHLAIENGNYDMVEFLLQDERCDIDIQNDVGQSPLVTAVMMSDLDIVKLLVKAGADLNSQDISGKTALLHALEDCDVEMAEYLINHGSDVNIVDSLGQSAFYLVINALDFKCVKIVRKLLKAGYSLEKDKEWMEQEGLDVQMVQSGNIVTKILRKIASQLHKLKMRQSTAMSSSLPTQTGISQVRHRILKIYG